MDRATDRSNAVVRPPVALALAFLVGLAVQWLYPLPFLPRDFPSSWVGAAIFASGFVLVAWAFATMRGAGTRVETVEPTTVIVTSGPYRYTRNPIYVGMFIGLVGLTIGFDSLWIAIALLPFYLVIRYGVIAREESYLERKFGDVYRSYKSQVRRWL
jgi:protein-S-isoprenylcysteine O-methyltransferase Ste14